MSRFTLVKTVDSVRYEKGRNESGVAAIAQSQGRRGGYSNAHGPFIVVRRIQTARPRSPEHLDGTARSCPADTAKRTAA